MDKGTFKQKIKNFKELELTFKGKNNYHMLLKRIKSDSQYYFAEIK